MRNATSPAFACLLAALLPGAASGGIFCDDLALLIAAAPTDFEDVDAAGDPFADAADCFTSRTLSGAKSYHCAWEHPYRDNAAIGTFDRLGAEIETCLGPSSDLDAGQVVNHPDSYAQRSFEAGAVIVTLSLKDKSARGQTFVFLGLAAEKPAE